MSDINTNKRLFDLVRYQRSELHGEGLITDEEYFWLCAEADMAKGGGSPSPRRLEDYDEKYSKFKDKLAAVSAERDALKAEKERLSGIADALLNHCDKEGGECSECGRIVCPHGEPLHFHHDGCPACAELSEVPSLGGDQ